MQHKNVIKRADIPREPAHDGEGERHVYLHSGDVSSPDFQALTVGYLHSGTRFDWHHHAGQDEIMYVIHGYGVVEHETGKLTYKPGDCFVFPAGVKHAIENSSTGEAEFIFVRMGAHDGHE